jgi:hypothetical protein
MTKATEKGYNDNEDVDDLESKPSDITPASKMGESPEEEDDFANPNPGD